MLVVLVSFRAIVPVPHPQGMRDHGLMKISDINQMLWPSESPELNTYKTLSTSITNPYPIVYNISNMNFTL